MPTITCTVTYDYDIFEDFFLFSLIRRRGYKSIKKRIFLPTIIFMIIAIVLSFLSFANYWPILVYSIALFLFVGFLLFFIPKIRFKSYEKSAVFTAPQLFTLHDTFFEVTHESGSSSGFFKIEYIQLKKIYETHKAFYFFLTNQQAYLLSKNVLTDQECINLSSLFQAELDQKKFKVCYKK